MSDVERRLQAAAAEVRGVARRAAGSPFTARRARTRHDILVFAAAFAAVAVVFGLIPFMTGQLSDRPGPAGSAPVHMPTSTISDDPVTTVSPGSCSASGVDLPEAVEGLPQAVSDTRSAIVAAASSCRLDDLEAVASEGLNTSFGGGGFANLRNWESDGSGQLGTLLRVLDASHSVVEGGDREDLYVWPAAFSYETWDEIPDPLVEELLSFHSQGEIDQMANFGSYAGWRVGITETGEWLFFVAGD